MLRPSNSLLGSSRAVRRRNVRAERRKQMGQAARGAVGLFGALVGGCVGLLLLWALPLLYLAASYLVVDLPVRYLTGRAAYGGLGVLAFCAALVVSFVGIARVVQDAPPLAPVRPRFAKAMLAAGWIAAILFTLADVA